MARKTVLFILLGNAFAGFALVVFFGFSNQLQNRFSSDTGLIERIFLMISLFH